MAVLLVLLPWVRKDNQNSQNCILFGTISDSFHDFRTLCWKKVSVSFFLKMPFLEIICE